MQERIRKAFNYLDRNHSGFINQAQLGVGLRILGLNPSEAEIKKFIETVDDTPNPSLDFKDFNNIYNICKEESKMTADLVRQYLQSQDKLNTGIVDYQDLLDQLTSGGEALTIEEVQTVLEQFDNTGDGQIDSKELLEALFKETIF